MPKVSVIVPVYNCEKTIERSVLSLMNQTLRDIEIITIDDHSTDRSYDKLSFLQKRYPRKITVLKNNRNEGAGYSRNRGMEVARGDYIGFLDADDTVNSTMYENLVSASMEENADISRSNRKIVFHNWDVSYLGRKSNYKEKKIIIPKEKLHYLHTEIPCVTNKLFRREFIKHHKFPEHLKWEDYPFTIPLLYKANKVVCVPDSIYYYHVNLLGTTISDTKKISPKIMDIFEDNKIIKKSFDSIKDKEVLKEIDFLGIQNLLQRLRDILYSRIPISEKRKFITLFLQYMDENYPNYQKYRTYQEYIESRRILKIRMFLIHLLEHEKYKEKEPLKAIQKILKK